MSLGTKMRCEAGSRAVGCWLSRQDRHEKLVFLAGFRWKQSGQWLGRDSAGRRVAWAICRRGTASEIGEEGKPLKGNELAVAGKQGFFDRRA